MSRWHNDDVHSTIDCRDPETPSKIVIAALITFANR
jgi:hypothetical protein